MLVTRFCLPWLACLLLAVPTARADSTNDPLRLVPIQSDLLIKVEQPTHLAKTLYHLDFIQGALKLDVVREAYDSTNARRALQLLSWFEKKLGAEKFELLDRIAGGGAVLAVKVGQNPAPALLVLQGKDEKAVEQFFTTGVELIEQELSREEQKVKLTQSRHRDQPYYSLGKDAHYARLGAAMLFSNKDGAIKAAIDTHLGKNDSVLKQPQLAEAKKLLPPRSQAWFWLNLDPVRATDGGKNFFEQPKKNPFLGLTTGALFEAAGRSPFLAASLHFDREELKIGFHLPRGRAGMAKYSQPYIPPENHELLPPLQPKNVILTLSTYIDLGRLWNERKELLGENELKELEKADNNAVLFLAGTRPSALLQQAGTCWRFVQVQGATKVYKKKPSVDPGVFAVTADMRNPNFGKSVGTILRAAALFGAFTVNLKLVEEKHNDVTLIGYRFSEDKALEGDTLNLRFGYSPCFATVGDQFLAASTIELGREMVDVLKKEQTQTRQPGGTTATLCSAGSAASLRAAEKQLLAQAILSQAQTPEKARQQLNDFLRLIEDLGNLTIGNVYEQERTRFELRLRLRK